MNGHTGTGDGFLDTLLGSESVAFIAEIFGRQPLAKPSSGTPFVNLGDWALIDRLVASNCDLLFAKDGVAWPGPRPSAAAETTKG
jgi:hypothetical protein